MTEKEKMLAHQMYDANYNKELHDERIAAKELCWEYNQLRPSNEEGQRAVLKKLLGKTGENFYITAPFWCDYGYNIELGENFYANHNLVILDCAKVKFGDNVFVAPDCGFHTAGHPIDFERRNAGFEYAYPITVGDNVWIGAGGLHSYGCRQNSLNIQVALAGRSRTDADSLVRQKRMQTVPICF